MVRYAAESASEPVETAFTLTNRLSSPGMDRNLVRANTVGRAWSVRRLNDLSGTPIVILQDTIGYYRARCNRSILLRRTNTMTETVTIDRRSVASTAIQKGRDRQRVGTGAAS
jgi:hypothetical protein